jgi:hypothetical protein
VKREWYIVKWVASNLFLFVVAFFLTTPAEVVSQLDKVLITILGPSASTKVGHQSQSAQSPTLEPVVLHIK